ncbi:4'-phosphopantetheinyl transferase family protein [Rubrivirga litoralis]|uniref:4'-phosphopantetheinyl transferase superfamily protein n=1 Tax=Rubrivirga litoralis TaxID=3075598 RepID=A0ABU3BSR2_9BACT|nr:4'-phosphopantetheinyl transferase superfamily protein [Rubrivirga sp. F394]MDT0632339.1 4'-phosphopantetheinyl transferase superfamily protein [Rubrivirga sp. F394]
MKTFRRGLPSGVEVALAGGGADPDALSAAERARAAAFGSADRRLRFALGREALRRLAAGRLGCAPPDVPLVVGPDGAPRLDLSRLDLAHDGAPPAPPAFVSIAHAGRGGAAVGAAALADRPVGVDVEAVAPRHPALWRRMLRDDELGALDALGGPTDEAQTLLWSMKEAVLKGQRTGLRAGARSVRLTLDRPAPAAASGAARAWAEASGPWRLRYGRVGGLWLVVAWAEGGAAPPA